MAKKSAMVKTTLNSQTMRWQVLPNSPVASSRTDDIWFFDENNGWLVNSSGYVCKTADGGTCWAPKFYLCPSSNGKPYLRCMGWSSEQNGWFGSVTGLEDSVAQSEPERYLDTLLHHTTDGGETWQPVTNLPRNAPAGICGFYAVNENVVYGSGTNDPGLPGPGVVKTTDGGASWQLFDMSEHADNLVDIYFFNENEGFVVGGKNHNCKPNPVAYPPPRLSKYARLKPVVLHTTDGGQSWNNVAADVEGFKCGEWGWKIQFVNPQCGFISLENFAGAAILKTTDSGKTWTRHDIRDACGRIINNNLEGIGFINENQGWVGGWGHNFTGHMNCYTADGGLTWQSQDNNPVVPHSDHRLKINRYRFVKRDGQLVAGYCSGQQVYKLELDCLGGKKSAFANNDGKKKALAASPRLEPARSKDAYAPMQSVMPGGQLAHSHDYQLECKPLEDGKMAISFSLPEGVNTVFAGLWNQFAFYVKTLINGKPQGEADENGRYTLVWDGRDESGNQVGKGVFICRLSVDGREGSSQNLTYSAA